MKKQFYTPRKAFLFLLVLSLPLYLRAQEWCNFNKEASVQRMYNNMAVLTHDSLGGRESASLYELKAALFIADIFEKIGLQAITPNNSYLQDFTVSEGVEMGSENSLRINRRQFRLMHDFYPLNISSGGHVSGQIVKVGHGIRSHKLRYNDYDGLQDINGKIFVVEMGIPSALTGRMQDDISLKVNTAIEMGASAVIFTNNGNAVGDPVFEPSNFRRQVSVPVVFVKGRALKTLMDATNPTVELKIDLLKTEKNARNVIGYIDNQKPSTIVIGAHYDHIGMGMSRSRRNNTPQLHPGADDNASGVVALIEMAARLKCTQYSTHNVLIMAFGAEEIGLLGSNHFVNSNLYPTDKINYMLNLDMIGRVDSINSKLYIIGLGSSPVWDSILNVTENSYFGINKGQRVSGGSDHASFYYKDIPVLFFFSGHHNDYHAPGDVIEKINFNGLYHVFDYVFNVVQNTGQISVPFTRVATSENQGRRRTGGVSMGIVPDHAYEQSGVRIADIIDGRTAGNAGLLRGDIIVRMDDQDIHDIQTYMGMLNTFNSGDGAVVQVNRNGEIMSFEVVF